MPNVFSLHYETPDGVTDAADATFLELLSWRTAIVTLRHRAPHGLEVRIPLDGYHHTTDFKAWREIRLKKDGVWWWAGFMDAPSLPNGGTSTEMVLPGWGNGAAFMFNHNSPRNAAIGVLLGPSWDADDQLLGTIQDNVHYGSTLWFPAGGMTLGTAANTITGTVLISGKSALEALYEAADIEGWPVRFGINNSGTFTIKSNGSTNVDQTSAIHLFDGTSGVRCTSHQADASHLASVVWVASRTPHVTTQLNGALVAGGTSVTVDSTAGFEKGDTIFIGRGTANAEQKVINAISSGTVLTTTTTYGTHANDEVVETVTDNRVRFDSYSAASTVQDDHHQHFWIVYNDQARDTTMRTQLAAAWIAAYDHPLVQSSWLVTDRTQIDRMLDAGLQPADTIKVTSDHLELGRVYANTTVTVREMVLTLTNGVCTQITLAVGDPLLDQLAEFERRLSGARNASTAMRAT